MREMERVKGREAGRVIQRVVSRSEELSSHRGAGERRVVAVLLPGAVEAEQEVLEEWVCVVEHGEAQDVDTLVHHVVQPKHGELLQEREGGKEGEREGGRERGETTLI